MNWSGEQKHAICKVRQWLTAKDSQIFRLFGYAGSGKTTLARHLAPPGALFAAFTGKAALVMRQKGCTDATTIHRLIYHPVGKSRERLQELEAEYARTGDPQIKEAIEEETRNLARPAWCLNLDSPLKHAPLLVVDECSMVDERMLEDLLSFGTPILALGDPAQLPPVFGRGVLMQDCDLCLTHVHRQARDNPVLDLATRVREGKRLEPGGYGDSRVIGVQDFDRRAINPDEWQVLVGRNVTRRRANKQLRYNLLGEAAADTVLAQGDKVVCLRNDHTTGLLNGQILRVTDPIAWYTSPPELDSDLLRVKLEDPDLAARYHVDAHTAHFLGIELDPFVRLQAQELDYGYALTCHKAQGSQWPAVVIVNEAQIFRHNAKKWLYTALTRALERVLVVG